LTWHDAASVRIKLKSPLHNAISASVLRAIAGSLFHKFAFFMDCLRMLHETFEEWVAF